MENFLITVAVICLLTAIVGGGLKAAGFEIPILRRPIQFVLVALLGVGSFGYYLYLHNQKPPGPPADISVTINPIGDLGQQPCPVNLRLSGKITVGKGTGDVVYRFVFVPTSGSNQTTIEGSEETVHFSAPGTKSISLNMLIKSTTAGDVFAQVVSPAKRTSDPAPFAVTCI